MKIIRYFSALASSIININRTAVTAVISVSRETKKRVSNSVFTEEGENCGKVYTEIIILIVNINKRRSYE